MSVQTIKGGSFLFEDRKANEIFTREDISEEQRMFARVTEEFMAKEILPRAEQIYSKDWALTGGFGADTLIHRYKGDSLTVFLEDAPAHLLSELRWLPSTHGRVTLLKLFSPHIHYQPKAGVRDHVAHPLLIYAELMHDGKERGRETAQVIYQRFLEGLFAKD